MAFGTVSSRGEWEESKQSLVPTRLGSLGPLVLTAAFAVGIGAAWFLLERRVERLSLIFSLKLCLEVTGLCLLLGVLPIYLAFRQGRMPWLPTVVVAIAIASLLVPTVARSLSLSAMFSYYGPVAWLLRASGLWRDGHPLDSSHLAVVVALVTLYLPTSLLIMTDAVRGLGRLPATAAELGSGPLRTFGGVVLPALLVPILATALIVFSQVLGVIVTPKILGSQDVTLPMLIDDLLKRELDNVGALRVASAELCLALPIAAIAAALMRQRLQTARRSLRPGHGSIVLGVPALILLALIAFVPIVLLALALVDSPVLALEHLWKRGVTTGWFSHVLGDARWKDVIPSSLAVCGTATLIALVGGLLLVLLTYRRALARSVLQWAALVVLFLPHNALGVILATALGKGALLPLANWLPGWLLGGIGQGVPALAMSTLILDRSVDRLRRPMNVAESLGAKPRQHFMLLMLPSLAPSLVAATIATVLISLDDVIFVRYLPQAPVDTFATEIFARARYSSSPELAVVCVFLLTSVLLLGGGGLLATHWRRLLYRDGSDDQGRL